MISQKNYLLSEANNKNTERVITAMGHSLTNKFLIALRRMFINECNYIKLKYMYIIYNIVASRVSDRILD